MTIMRLLFDLDGTLTDPFVGITTCIRHTLAGYDVEVPAAEDLRWCIGPPLLDTFKTLLNTTDDELAAAALRTSHLNSCGESWIGWRKLNCVF